MYVDIALGEIFNPENGYGDFLPEGTDGDGVSKEHFQGADERLRNEHLPTLEKADEELADASYAVGLALGDLLVYGSEDEELKELIRKISNAFEIYKEKVSLYQKILTKMNRWLGWFQGVIVVSKGASLDEMKLINKNS